MDAKQLDLDGVEVGRLHRVTIKARRPAEDDRPEGDPAVKGGGHTQKERTYVSHSPTWREAVDHAMDLYPATEEDDTEYTIKVRGV